MSEIDDLFEIEENVTIPDVDLQRRVQSGVNWSTRLQRLRAIPGVDCRIIKGLSDRYEGGYLVTPADIRARNLARNIKRDLYRLDEYEKWKISYRRIESHSYSVWATYLGRMTEQEMELDRVRRAQYAIQFRRRHLSGRLKAEFPHLVTDRR